MDTNGVPDRWLGCPPFGELIGDLFLPFKTPLSEDIPLPVEHKFSPRLFFKAMKERNDRIRKEKESGKKLEDIEINIGLVINLTFSSKYYEGREIMDQDVEFRQIACRGHNEAPQPKERNEFIQVCNTFLAKNPHKHIAVHCTHGFNRTGFMICYYLCREADWDIGAAILHFASKRPPGIYKQDYINVLFNEFGCDDDPIPQAAPKPAWDSELDFTVGQDDDNQLLHNNLNQIEFYEGITDVHLVRDEALKQRIYRHCCMLLNYEGRGSGISFPGAQPVSMDQQNIQLLAANRYRVSWKADGCRYMLYIENEDNIFFLTRSLQLWRVVGLRFPKMEDLNSHLTDTLLDGEMVTDDFNGQKIPKYLIYDVISLNGKIVADQNFDKRCGKIKCVIVEARRRAKHANIIPREGEPFKVADKGFYMLHDARKTWDLQVTHEKDGLIFQPVDAPYVGGTCSNILKWKPPNLNSIDFRLVVREENKPGCLPESYAYLHVSNKADPITKLRLNRDLQNYRQYHNKIVEMICNNDKWEVIRERTDKLTANSFETASAVYRSIRYPVTEKYLFDYISKIPHERRPPPTK